MSGPMPHAVAQAASAAAFAAEAAALGLSAREFAMLKGKASLLDAAEGKARAAAGREQGVLAQARAWAETPHRVRMVLVNLGSKTPGDAYTRARMPWDAFSLDDRMSIASVRNELMRGLERLDCLSW